MFGTSRYWLACSAAIVILIGTIRPVAAQSEVGFFDDEAEADSVIQLDAEGPIGLQPQAATRATTAGAETTGDEDMVEVEVVKERYPNRAVKIERHVTLDENRNYVNHGLWTMYSPNGTMIARGEYWHGKRQGKWVRWFVEEPKQEITELTLPVEDEQGEEADDEFAASKIVIGPEFDGFNKPYRSEANFVEGKLVGVWSIVDADDRPICSFDFDQDDLHGTGLWYFPNGQKRRQINFEQGAIVGEWKEWESNGTVAKIETYVDGRRKVPYSERHDSGEKYCHGHYLYAKANVDVSKNWWDGIVEIGIDDDTQEKLKHGLWTYWYRNGGKMTEGEFDAGKPIGLHVWWYENGQQKAQGEFAEGQQTGQWTWWHENGMKQTQGQIVAGRKVGTWSSWKADGTLGGEKNHGGPSRAMNARRMPRHQMRARVPARNIRR